MAPITPKDVAAAETEVPEVARQSHGMAAGTLASGAMEDVVADVAAARGERSVMSHNLS